MAQVKILVKNKTGSTKQFLIFNDRPAFSSEVGQAWINVWGKSPGAGASGGQTTFQITENYYAVCGMAPQKLQTDLIVSTNDSQAVKLGSGDAPKADVVPALIDQGGMVFDKKNIGILQKNGSFGINTKAYDEAQFQLAFCGIGMKGPFPNIQDVVPTSVWQAAPNTQYQITPKRVYFISTGSYNPGKIVDFAQLGAYASIDFTGRKETVAYTELLDDGTYTPPAYSFES